MSAAASQFAQRLGDRLRQAGYDRAGILGALGASTEAKFDEAIRGRARLPRRSELANLIRLFLLNQAVPREAAIAALGEVQIEDAAALGILAVHRSTVSAKVQIRPYESLLVAADSNRKASSADFVSGVSPSAQMLAKLTPRIPVGKALDLGTGCGVHALLAARHSREVVAVDINPRAVWYARLNAGLNRLPGLDIREGSWLGPVAGERFDLITINPPYVMSPDHELLYRDGGLPGDQLCRDLVAGAADQLSDGGFAVILCAWAQAADADWWSRPAEWIDRHACDGVILRHGTDNVLLYAVRWNEYLKGSDPAKFRAAMERWIAYYKRLGISRVAFGTIVLRKRPGAEHWVRGIDGVRPTGAAGDQLLGIFAGEDFLQSIGSDEELLSADLGPLATSGGLDLAVTFDPSATAVIQALAGTRPLGSVIAEASARLQVGEAELRATVLPAVRQLLGLGLLRCRHGQRVHS